MPAPFRIRSDGWTGMEFDDSQWARARITAQHGDAPWGSIEPDASKYMTPYMSGSSDGTRIVYLPSARALDVAGLDRARTYIAMWWNPRTAEETAIPSVETDAEGRWHSPVPPVSGQDWVLILRPRKR